MKSIKFIIIFFLVILGIVITPNFTKASVDTSFTFENDKLFSSNELGQQRWYDNSSNNVNIRNKTEITEHFNGTYSFENEIDGTTGTNIDFLDVDLSDLDCNNTIISNLDGHNKVLEINDYSNTGKSGVSINAIDDVEYGSVEFWIRITDSTKKIDIILEHGSSDMLTLRIDGNDFQTNDGGGGYNDIYVCNANIWYHVSIDFECSVGYRGLPQYDYDITINGLSLGPFDMTNNEPHVSRFTFFTDDTDNGYSAYLDGIGYSWDIYTTYDFESDTIGLDPIDWITLEATSCYGDVFQNNTKVVRLRDFEDGEHVVNCTNIFDYQEYGTIAFDFNVNVSFDMKFYPQNITEYTAWIVSIWDNAGTYRIRTTDAGVYHNIAVINRLQWYRLTFEFRANSTEGYKGLSPFTYNVYLDNVKIASDYNFQTDFLTAIPQILFKTEDGSTGIFMFDNVAYSWERTTEMDYNIGDNLFPYSYISQNEYEVHEWEFRNNYKTYTQYIDGFDNPSGWFDYQDAEPVIDDVNTLVIGGTPEEQQRWVVVHIEEGGGLERNFGGINELYYSITYNFGINEFDDTDVGANAIVMSVRDDDDSSIIAGVYLRYNGNIDLFYNETSSVIGTFTPIGNYSITYLINFPSKLFTFQMYDWDDKSLIVEFTAPFFNSTANDIDQVIYKHIATTSEVDSYLFSISMSDTSGSLSDDIGEIDWENIAVARLGIFGSWYFTEFNLINLYGNFENISLFTEYLGGIVLKNYLNWSIVDTYKLTNIYEVFGNLEVFSTRLTAWIYHNFTFDFISVSGVKLTNATNSYPLILTYSEVDIQESYFYVDSSNILQFRHIANDTNLEYIQAEFNVNDVSSDNYSIAYRSYIDNNAYGYMRVNFTDTSNVILMKNSLTTTRFLLEQNRVIRTFIVLITDKDNDVITGLTTGFIYNIKLLDVINVQVSIITESLLNMIIPLIIILIPTLLFSRKFGKQVIIPFIILFSLVLTMTGTLPPWLFFIILFPSLVMIFFKSREVSE